MFWPGSRVNLSFVTEQSSGGLYEPRDDAFFGTNGSSSYDANGNSILSILGAFIDTLGEFIWWREESLIAFTGCLVLGMEALRINAAADLRFV